MSLGSPTVLLATFGCRVDPNVTRSQGFVEGAKAVGTVAVASTLLGTLSYTSEDHVAPASYPWDHTGPFSSFDAAACVPTPKPRLHVHD